jgi:transposase-like protein
VERKWKERYSQKFRRRAVSRMNACENITRLSRELGVSRGLLYTWRYRLEPPDAEVEGRDTVPIILSQLGVHPPRFQLKVSLME